MRIMVNASIIKEGGALQNSVNFIIRSIQDTDNKWYFIVSYQVRDAIISAGYKTEKKNFLILRQTPASILRRRLIVRQVNQSVSEFSPDLIYSIGAPSYIRFKVPEVQRLTNPWITHPNKYAFRSLSLKERVFKVIKTRMQKHYLKHVRYFITQTNRSKAGIIKITGTEPDNIGVIANTLSPNFYQNSKTHDLRNDFIYFFSLAAPYPHKNLSIIPRVASYLKIYYKLENFRFLLTLPHDSDIMHTIEKLNSKYNSTDCIINLGPIHQSECMDYYKKATCVFLPTLLETSSATFIEAMFCETPIITAETDISKELCGDAALYFEPFNYKSAAEKIMMVLKEPELQRQLVLNGKNVFKKHSNYDNSYTETIDFFGEVLRKTAKV